MEQESRQPNIDYMSANWHQGYLDGWDGIPPRETDDPSYKDGYITGSVEKDAGVNRDGSIPQTIEANDPEGSPNI